MSVTSSKYLDFSKYNSILDQISHEIAEISKDMKGSCDNRQLLERCGKQKGKAISRIKSLYNYPEMTRETSGTLLVALKISQFASKINEIARLQRELTFKEAAKNVKNYDEMLPEVAKKITSVIFKDEKGFYLYPSGDDLHGLRDS